MVYGINASRGGAGSLTFERVFTSYSLFTLVMTPLTSIIIALPTLASSFTSFGRIQNFLNGKERDDNRVLQGDDDDDGSKEFKEVDVALDADTVASIKGKFSWTEESEPVIDIREWNIRRREFTLVLGPIGCGKSTLLKALLGELSAFEGSIRTNYSGVSFCDQTPWLPNESVRDIIIGPQAFDESWYDAVVRACALDIDVRTWPNGDETLVGTKGISMSGGQKHRLVRYSPSYDTGWLTNVGHCASYLLSPRAHHLRRRIQRSRRSYGRSRLPQPFRKTGNSPNEQHVCSGSFL